MAEPIRLYLDEDAMSRALVRALRSRSVDVLTAKEAQRMAASDEDHLLYAASVNRTLVTFNVRDFAQLHTNWLRAGRHHAGIVVSDQLQVGILLRRLLKLLATYSAQEMHNRLEYLSNWR